VKQRPLPGKADCHVYFPVRDAASFLIHGPPPGSQFHWRKADKSPGAKSLLSTRNSIDISKAEIHLGMSEFDPSQGSQPVLRFSRLPKGRENCPEIRAFRAFGFVSGLLVRLTWGGNRRKSPASSGNIPVLRRLSAETGSITTAARWRQFNDHQNMPVTSVPTREGRMETPGSATNDPTHPDRTRSGCACRILPIIWAVGRSGKEAARNTHAAETPLWIRAAKSLADDLEQAA